MTLASVPAARERLYLSGPMTGIPEWNFPAFNHVEAELAAVGYEVANPAGKGLVEGWTWARYLRYDLKVLLTCDAVATLDGWEHSRGARLETRVAEELEMAVWHWTDWLAAPREG